MSSDEPRNEPFAGEAPPQNEQPPATANEPIAAVDSGPAISVFADGISDPRDDPTLAHSDDNYASIVELVAQRKQRERTLQSIGVVDATQDQERYAARQLRKRQLAMSHPIPISFVTKTIENKFTERRLHNELFFYVPFLIAFLFFFIIGRHIEEAYWAASVIKGELEGSELPTKESAFGLRPGEVEANHIARSFLDIKKPEDWHLWIQNNVMELFWGGGPDRNPDASIIQNNYVEGGNWKVGAMRVRQIRVRSDSCDINKDFVNTTAATALLGSTRLSTGNSSVPSNGDVPCWGELRFIDRGEYISKVDIVAGSNVYKFEECDFAGRMQEGALGVYPCSGNVFDVPYSLSTNAAKARVETLRAETNDGGVDFIDLRSTRLIIVEFLVYHPAFDMFTSVKCMSEISQGGKFLNSVRAQSFSVWSKKQAGHTAYFLIFFILAVFPYMFKLSYDFIMAVKIGRGIEFVTTFWNFLEFANLVVFAIVFILRCIWWNESEKLNFKLPGGDKYQQEVDFIGWLYLLQVYFNAFNTIAIFLKIMKFVQLNPRLNLISRTMANAQQNLVGVLIIFVLIVLSYSLTGVLIFSNGMEEFRDLEYSFSTLMRFLIGDFDYGAMRDENRFLAGLFFWTYILLGLFLMLNFIVGVIGEAFNEEFEKTRVEPLNESISRFAEETSVFLKAFFFAPLITIRGMFETRKTRFGETGRLTCVLRTLEAYRLALPNNLTPQQMQELDRATLEQLLPDPSITREDLNLMFVDILGEQEAEASMSWLTEAFLDATWMDVYNAFKLAPDEDEAVEIDELSEHIKDATEASLKWVLGLPAAEHDAQRKADAEVRSIQELFAPGAENLRQMGEISARLRATEEHLASILATTARLDQTLSKLL